MEMETDTESEIFIAIPFYADSWQAGQRRMPSIGYKRVVTAIRVCVCMYREAGAWYVSQRQCNRSIEQRSSTSKSHNWLVQGVAISLSTKEKPIGKLLCRKYLRLSNWWIECVLMLVLFMLLLNAADTHTCRSCMQHTLQRCNWIVTAGQLKMLSQNAINMQIGQ